LRSSGSHSLNCGHSRTTSPRDQGKYASPGSPLTLLGPQAAAGPGSGDATPTRSIRQRRKGQERSGEVAGREAGSAAETRRARVTGRWCGSYGDRWRRPRPELELFTSALSAGVLASDWLFAPGAGHTSGLRPLAVGVKFQPVVNGGHLGRCGTEPAVNSSGPSSALFPQAFPLLVY
jgi:hypothetical protein